LSVLTDEAARTHRSRIANTLATVRPIEFTYAVETRVRTVDGQGLSLARGGAVAVEVSAPGRIEELLDAARVGANWPLAGKPGW
jgi:hypothetical protein